MKIRVVLSIGFIFFLSGILGLIPQFVQAQTANKCGITAATAALHAAHPELTHQIQKATTDLELETLAKISGQNAQLDACSDLKVVPVVFHIIHENGPENISDQTVFDAIRMLNEDFRLWNDDASEIIQAFKPIVGEALIEFRLAQIDLFGNATNGIDRVVSAETNVGDDGSKLNPWPRSKYLNIWVVKTNPSGAAAYAYLPGSVASGFAATIDGIITNYTFVGDGERTLTHEVGHWINLRHTWGPGNDAADPGNCGLDDGVGDTPNCIGTLGGCDTTRTTCSSLDNVQNYMDYAFCEMMFTSGQVSRMRAALSSSTAQRSSLSTASNLIATGVDGFTAAFSADLSEACTGAPVVFVDESYNRVCQWAWSFPGAVPSTSNERSPVVVYNNPGNYDVTLTVSNDTGSTSITIVDYMTITASETLPYSETFTGGSDWLVSGQGGPSWIYANFTFDGTPGSMALYNFGQSTGGEVDDLISPSIDMTVMQSAQLSFKVAYAQVDVTTNDILRVSTSGDCGSTWNTSYIVGGASLGSPNGQIVSNFTPSDSNDWKSVSVNLTPSVLTESFRFRFEFTSDEGNNIFIDNINISGTFNSVPLLVSPSNYADNQPTTIIMDWDAVDNVDFYDYQIDTVLTMDSPFLISGTHTFVNNLDNGTDTEYLLFGLDSGVTIYWNVRTRTGTTSSAWSSIWRYTTMLPAPPSTPLQVSPANFSVNQPFTVTMDWNAVDNVNFYDYQIDTVATLNSPFLISGTTAYINNSDNGTDTEYLLAGLDTGMVIYWSVRARTNVTNSSWSSVWKYTTILSVNGVDESLSLLKSSLKVFPNPSSGEVTIGFDLYSTHENVSIQIFDMLGREIEQSSQFNQLSAGHHELQINAIQQAGVYYVRLNADDLSSYSRFTITK